MKTLFAAMARSVNSPRASSMGRLFDGVAALVGLPRVISFEGEAAMALEFAADETANDAYPLPLRSGTPLVADWEPLVRGVLADRAAGVPLGRISGRFHNALAELALATAQRAGVKQVALSGGCFQNALLSDRVGRRLSAAGFSVYTQRRVPPGDGGIALGQICVAARRIATEEGVIPCALAFPEKWSRFGKRTICPWARSIRRRGQGDLPGLHARGPGGRLRDRPRRFRHQPRRRGGSGGDLLL